MQTNLADFIRDTPEGREADAILRTCVHCGFCTATCPTYQLLGDELDGPRGRKKGKKKSDQQGMGGMSGMEGQKGMSGMQGQKGMGGMSGMEGQKGMGGMGGMSGMVERGAIIGGVVPFFCLNFKQANMPPTRLSRPRMTETCCGALHPATHSAEGGA